MTMYWLMRLKIIIYLLLRSEYLVPAFFCERLKLSFSLNFWIGDDSASGFSFVGSVLVDLMVCCSCLKSPLRVVRDKVRCLKMSFEVRPGHLIKFLLFIV